MTAVALVTLRNSGLQGLKNLLTNRIHQVLHHPADYQEWIHRFDTLTDEKRTEIELRIQELDAKPLISVVMPVFNPPPQFLDEAIQTVREQVYPYWELCIVDDASTDLLIRDILERHREQDKRIKVVYHQNNAHISAASNSALKLTNGEYVVMLDHVDCLHPEALSELAFAISADDKADLLYTDEDKLSPSGRREEPFFKPDWSPFLALSQAYLGHLVCCRASLLRELEGFRQQFDGSQDYDLWLRMSTVARHIVHIPRVLYHWRKHLASSSLNPQSKPYAHEAGRKAVSSYLAARYPDHHARVVDGQDLFTYRTKFDMPANLLVSIIIPTKDHVDLLCPCVKSILSVSSWKNLEILILDNGSKDAATLSYFRSVTSADSRVKIIPADMPFNWSRLNNHGAKLAHGEVFVFLNNDTKVIAPDWIESLAGFARLSDVGVVGALLLYEDGTIQHDGVVVGMNGWADHVFQNAAAEHNASGPFVSPVLTRNVLAVTGACSAISAFRFHELGGFDESFTLCGSDVELCLRAHARGYYNVLCAEARLFHYESKTRTSHVPDEDFVQSEKKYAPYRVHKVDPFYNPNLSLYSKQPILKGIN